MKRSVLIWILSLSWRICNLLWKPWKSQGKEESLQISIKFNAWIGNHFLNATCRANRALTGMIVSLSFSAQSLLFGMWLSWIFGFTYYIKRPQQQTITTNCIWHFSLELCGYLTRVSGSTIGTDTIVGNNKVHKYFLHYDKYCVICFVGSTFLAKGYVLGNPRSWVSYRKKGKRDHQAWMLSGN